MVYTNCCMVYTIHKWYIPWGNLPDGQRSRRRLGECDSGLPVNLNPRRFRQVMNIESWHPWPHPSPGEPESWQWTVTGGMMPRPP